MYRGSSRLVDVFDPRDNRSKPSPDTPNLVYASSDEGYAWCFSFPWLIEDEQAFEHFLGKFTDRGNWRLVLDKNAYERMTKSRGYMYMISPRLFHRAKKYGAPSVEWATTSRVEPLSYTRGNSRNEAMRCGVQIYVADHSTVLSMRAAKDDGVSIIIKLDEDGECINQRLAPETFTPLRKEVEL